MRKRMWKRLVSIVCVLAMVGSWSASAQTQKGVIASEETLTVAEPTVSMLPQNIQMLLENAEQTDVVIPSDNPYELTVRHADDTYTTEVYSVPVKYTDAEGKTQYVDTSMQERTLWQTLTFNDTRYNQEGYVALAYDEDIDDGVSVDEAFTLSVPVRDEQESARCVTADDGSGKIIYPQAFGEHTYVEYINTYTGFKENIVLEQNIGQNTFDFVWESDTHIPVLIDDNKAIKIVQKANPQKADYTISPLYVYDSFDPTTSDDPYSHKHWTEDCRYDIMEQEDGVYTIRAIVSEDYLNHPETVYLVIIDPSVVADVNTAFVYDSYVTEEYPSLNYGDYTYLRFGTQNSKRIYSYVKFNILPTLPKGAYYTSATFKVTFRTGQNTPTNMKGTVKSCLSEFVEGEITWNNRPSVSGAYYSVSPKVTNGYLDYYEFPVYNIVRDSYGNGDPCAFMFTYQNETYADYNSVVSSESDAARAPKLTINYLLPTTETSGITDDGYYYIRNGSTGKYLTLSADGANLELGNYTGARNQLWQTQYNGNGSYMLVPRADTTRCIDSGNTTNNSEVGISLISSTTSDPEQLNDCSFILVYNDAGYYRISSRTTSSSWALSTGGDSAFPVHNYTYSNAAHQRWYFEEYSLTITPEEEWVVDGEILRITPNTMALNLAWTSSDADVAFVLAGSSGGLVGAQSPGTVTITATAENGVSASCTITVRDPDPFHPDNIEYIRVKKYDQSSSGGDGDITTIVTKSIIEPYEHFQAYSPGSDTVSFKIDDSLVDDLNARERDYPSAILALAIYHEAKVMTDELVSMGLIEGESAEYYGIWATISVQLEIETNRLVNTIELVSATASAAYHIYTVVSAMKVAQMPANTTQTYSATNYRSTAYLADDLLMAMTNNSSSSSVMLGTTAGGFSWHEVAEQQGRSYFYSPNYNTYVSLYGYDAMLATNRFFIFNAKEAGKTFWFSHNPIDQLNNYPNSTYAYELQYLKRLYGFSEFILNDNIFKSGNYYYLVP